MSTKLLSSERQKTRDNIARKFGGLSYRAPKKKKKAKAKKVKPMPEDIVAVARNAGEMQLAQQQLISWCAAMMVDEKANLDEVEQNLETAKKGKQKLDGWKRQIRLAKKRFTFYEKLHAALGAGYTILPNMNLDIFAIRTTKAKPKHGAIVMQEAVNGSYFEQSPNQSKLGEGENVDPWPSVQQLTTNRTNSKGEKEKMILNRTDGFQPVDFPFKLVKPQIVSDTARALALKVFDRIGVTPHRTVRKRDPMVIGEVIYKEGYTEKVVAFLITWWADTSDLRI